MSRPEAEARRLPWTRLPTITEAGPVRTRSIKTLEHSLQQSNLPYILLDFFN